MPNQTKQTATVISGRARKKRRVNPTWAAAHKYSPAFTYVAPEMFD
ncbi:MAG: hypothetical protein IKX17_01565 [Prevotella sp.]|nr:hypothetical protein [Prevotella sp.]